MVIRSFKSRWIMLVALYLDTRLIKKKKYLPIYQYRPHITLNCRFIKTQYNC